LSCSTGSVPQDLFVLEKKMGSLMVVDLVKMILS
jgi:hypothetical protein